MRRLITVIYPGEYRSTYSINSDLPNANILEDVFAKWNNGSGRECQMFLDSCIRSLSVNDIVKINDVYYQCKPVGWEKVSEDYVKSIEDLVIEHVGKETNCSYWFALHEVMRNLTKTSSVI